MVYSIWRRQMNFLSTLKKKYSSWDDLEKAIESLETTKEKGDAFEQFAYAYFLYYKDIYQIEEIYMGPEIPENYKKKYKLEKNDSGVDGLIIRNDNSSVAYQVKFRSHQEAPSYDDLTSFWTEAENTTERCIFANCYTLPKQAYKKKDQFFILRDSLSGLDNKFYEWLYEYACTGESSSKVEKYYPLPHQDKIISDVINGFDNYDRGKLLAACGTGKTLTALWIKEKLKATITLFVAPNLALIKQTLEAWMPQAEKPFTYLCVCSDKTVALDEKEDDFTTDLSYIDVPVTTDPERIREFIHLSSSKDKVIFSTYQSLDAIVFAMENLPEFSFDIAFFDESHRTAGNKDSEMFVYGMNDVYIPCKKRLFMTATERFVNPRIVGRAKQLNYEVFSMDNEEQYGPTFSSLSFRDAIEQNIISDYKIVLCCMNESELTRIVQENQIIDLGDRKVDAQVLFKQVLLSKTINDIGINKIISYHVNIASAKEFITPNNGVTLSNVVSDLSDAGVEPCDVYSGHINGTMSAGIRKEIFDEFIKTPYGVISNARCLTEGVDVPIIDAVYFADPKNSIVDIIQAVGRSLRKDKTKPDKVSYIIIPVIISDKVAKFEDIDPKEFSTLHTVIQALRDQDRILADYIDKLNLKAAKGKGKTTEGSEAPIIIELSEDLDITDFSNSLSLRIAEVNKDPATIAKDFILTKVTRTSGTKRTFRTVGDYTIDAYYNNLIIPTLQKYSSYSIGLPREAITIDHNNVSHCVKIGALQEKDMKFFMTDIGKAMMEYKDIYKDIFKEQLLKYYELDPITRIPKFPYRMALKVLREVKYITRFEFVYSLYIGKYYGDRGVQDSIDRINYIRETYPNIEILNEVNKKIVLQALNTRFDTTLTFEDIWTSRTTVYNQFNYIKKHFLIWEDIFEQNSEKDVICTLGEGAERIADILDKTKEIETCPLDSLRKNYTSYKAY